MKEHKPLMKLLSFKLMVGLIFVEQVSHYLSVVQIRPSLIQS